MSLRLPARPPAPGPSGARLRDVLRCGNDTFATVGVDQRVGGSLSDTATTAKEERPDYDLMISQYDDLVQSYYESLYKGLHEGEQSDEGLMIGSRMHDLQNELEDAERERHLSVEQITKLQSSRFQERMATNNYWKQVALVKINEKLDVYENAVNGTEMIDVDQLLPIIKWLVANRPHFITTHVNRFDMLNEKLNEKL